jgi:hypothetical protein
MVTNSMVTTVNRPLVLLVFFSFDRVARLLKNARLECSADAADH